MKYLLDTNIISALRVAHKNPAVKSWSESVSLQNQFISVFTIAEIERGIQKKEREDPNQGTVLRKWFETQVIPVFSARIITFDYHAARTLGSFRVPEHAPLEDALIAAIAAANGMTLVTRNIKHVQNLPGVSTLNPWQS